MRRVGGAGVAAALVAVLLAASVGTAEAAFSQGAYSGTTNQVVNPTNGARGPVGLSVSGSAITAFEITVVLTCSLPTGESKPLPAILRGTTPIPLRSDGSFSARVTARWLAPIELTVAGHISGGTASGSATSSGATLTGASGTLTCTGSTATFTASHGQAVANATVFVRGDGPVAFDGSPAAQHVGRTVHIKVTVATAVPDDIVQSGAVTYRAWWVRLVLPEALIGNFGENNCSHDTVRHQVVTHPVPPDGRIQFTDSWVVPSVAPVQYGVCIELLGSDGNRVSVPDSTPQPWPVAPFLVCPVGWRMTWGAAGTGCLKPK